MAQQLADDWQTKPTARTEAGIGVPEIVKANAFKSCTPSHRPPRTFEISAWLLGIIPRHDIRAESIEAGQDRKRRSIENHCLPAGLGVGEKQQPAFEVHLFPFEVQDFAEPTAGE